ncbi:hypothetical protein Ciccas_001744 [Cichlidogyrus casuarinus]|uniref:Gamma-soluble NSF attachment protein n=1 Tax=Cichlidogyrus casuarinus TaxID=1844966 RepID=A0ABD2QJ99_9PLAT
MEKYDQAAQIFEKMAESHLALGSEYHSARNLAKAASYYLKGSNVKKALSLYDRAGLLYRQTGKTDSAMTMYKEAAESVLNIDDLKAADYFLTAAQICSGDRKFIEASNYTLSAASIMVKHKKMIEAENSLRLNIRYCIESELSTSDKMANPAQLIVKSVVSLMILKLLNGDVIAGRKLEKEAIDNWAFRSTEEYHDVSRLLAALEVNDGTEARLALSTNTFKQTHFEFSKLIADIPLPKMEASKVGAQLVPNLSASAPAQSREATCKTHDEEDDEDDIC